MDQAGLIGMDCLCSSHLEGVRPLVVAGSVVAGGTF